MKILIADDDENMREYMRTILEHAGHKVECIDDGMKAWAKESIFNPDVMIFDEHMPEMTGLQLTEQFRRQGNTKPIIIASSSYDTKTLLQALRNGVSDFIMKPTGQDEVLNKVTSVYNRYRTCFGAAPAEIIAVMNTLKGLLAATQTDGFCVLCKMHGGHDDLCEAGRAEAVIQRLG